MPGCIYWAVSMRLIYKARNFYGRLSAFRNRVGNNKDKKLASVDRRVPSDRQYFHTLFYTYVLMICVCLLLHRWRAEDDLQKSVLSFYHVGTEEQAQVARLDSKSLYLVNHLWTYTFITHEMLL